MPELAELLVEGQRRDRQRRYEHADRDGIGARDRAIGELQHEGRGNEPKSEREIEPLRRDVNAGDAFEMRGEREDKPAADGAGGGRLVLRIAGDPWRDRKPQTQCEACPVLPLGRHASFDSADVAPVLERGVVSSRYGM